jgi:hypothetical protein
MNKVCENCGNCKYFAATFGDGPAEGSAILGECVNSESDYANRTVSSSFCCEMYESRLES